MFEVTIENNNPYNFATIDICCQEMFRLVFNGLIEPRKKYKEKLYNYMILKLAQENTTMLIKCPACGVSVTIKDNRRPLD